MSSIENVSKNIQFMLDYILIFTDINAKVTHHHIPITIMLSYMLSAIQTQLILQRK